MSTPPIFTNCLDGAWEKEGFKCEVKRAKRTGDDVGVLCHARTLSGQQVRRTRLLEVVDSLENMSIGKVYKAIPTQDGVRFRKGILGNVQVQEPPAVIGESLIPINDLADDVDAEIPNVAKVHVLHPIKITAGSV